MVEYAQSFKSVEKLVNLRIPDNTDCKPQRDENEYVQPFAFVERFYVVGHYHHICAEQERERKPGIAVEHERHQANKKNRKQILKQEAAPELKGIQPAVYYHTEQQAEKYGDDGKNSR